MTILLDYNCDGGSPSVGTKIAETTDTVNSGGRTYQYADAAPIAGEAVDYIEFGEEIVSREKGSIKFDFFIDTVESDYGIFLVNPIPQSGYGYELDFPFRIQFVANSEESFTGINLEFNDSTGYQFWLITDIDESQFHTFEFKWDSTGEYSWGGYSMALWIDDVYREPVVPQVGTFDVGEYTGTVHYQFAASTGESWSVNSVGIDNISITDVAGESAIFVYDCDGGDPTYGSKVSETTSTETISTRTCQYSDAANEVIEVQSSVFDHDELTVEFDINLNHPWNTSFNVYQFFGRTTGAGVASDLGFLHIEDTTEPRLAFYIVPDGGVGLLTKWANATISSLFEDGLFHTFKLILDVNNPVYQGEYIALFIDDEYQEPYYNDISEPITRATMTEDTFGFLNNPDSGNLYAVSYIDNISATDAAEHYYGLTVNIIPPEGTWSCDGGSTYNDSGDEVILLEGSNTIVYADLEGFTTPTELEGPTVISLTEDTVISVVYDGAEGVCSIIILGTDSGTWSLDGSGSYISGEEVYSDVGESLVEFTSVSGYSTPESFSVTISYLETTLASGRYVLLSPTQEVKTLADYLSNVVPDYSTEVLDINPHQVILTTGSFNQSVYQPDGGDTYTVTLNENVDFFVTLTWKNLDSVDRSTIIDFFYNPDKANGFAKSFVWVHPTEGTNYVVKFTNAISESYDRTMRYTISSITLKIIGTI